LTAPERTGLSVGDRLVIIPAHACTVVNLHPKLLLISDPTRWLPVDARGWQ
jgi:D-serine deaminase-like pyridoxal phosphate-dependent protein